MTETMMQIDAALLILCSMNIAILLCEDPAYRSFGPAALMTYFGATVFLQAMWLLGVWVPGVAGFPWPRISCDVGLFAISAWRVAIVLRENYVIRRDVRRSLKNGF